MREGRPERDPQSVEAAAEFAPTLPFGGSASASAPAGAAAAPALSPWTWVLPLLGAALLAALYGLRGILAPFAFAAVLSYLIAPAVDYLQRRTHMPRALAILCSYAAIALCIGGFVALVLPDLVGELQRLAQGLPASVAGLQNQVAQMRAGYGSLPLPPALRSAVDQALLRAEADAHVALTQALGGLIGAFGLIFPMVLAPVLAYYFLGDLPRLRIEFARLLPPGARQPTLACLSDLDAVLAGWIRGQLLIAAAVGVLVTVATLLLHLRYAFTLGLVAGLGELIPYFGPILGALPALLVAAGTGGTALVIWTGLAFLAIQQIESVFLAPRIVGGSVGLHPLVVIAALLMGEHLGGLPGVILAVPIAGSLRVLGGHAVAALTAARTPRRLT